MTSINEEILNVWESYSEHHNNLMPIFHNDVEKKGLLFIGMNPSFSEKGIVDFPRFSRQMIMSEINQRKLNERHQIHSRI